MVIDNDNVRFQPTTLNDDRHHGDSCFQQEPSYRRTETSRELWWAELEELRRLELESPPCLYYPLVGNNNDMLQTTTATSETSTIELPQQDRHHTEYHCHDGIIERQRRLQDLPMIPPNENTTFHYLPAPSSPNNDDVDREAPSVPSTSSSYSFFHRNNHNNDNDQSSSSSWSLHPQAFGSFFRSHNNHQHNTDYDQELPTTSNHHRSGGSVSIGYYFKDDVMDCFQDSANETLKKASFSVIDEEDEGEIETIIEEGGRSVSPSTSTTEEASSIMSSTSSSSHSTSTSPYSTSSLPSQYSTISMEYLTDSVRRLLLLSQSRSFDDDNASTEEEDKMMTMTCRCCVGRKRVLVLGVSKTNLVLTLLVVVLVEIIATLIVAVYLLLT